MFFIILLFSSKRLFQTIPTKIEEKSGTVESKMNIDELLQIIRKEILDPGLNFKK